jgi:predicted DNA-binding transcriptional regulator YafY
MGDLKRSVRLMKLLTRLRGSSWRKVDDLAARFGVSARTIYRDLADLERSYPIERSAGIESEDAGSAGYRLPPGAELPPVKLSLEETALLRALLDQPLLARDRVLAKAVHTLEEKLSAAVQGLEETPAGLKIAPVDRSGPRAGIALAGLKSAIESHRTTEIVYESLSGSDQRPTPRGLDPWKVFHRGDAWYVVGWCRVHREPRIFRLDRISHVGVLAEPARAPEPGFDLDEFLEGAWAVFYGHSRHEVVLEFDAALAPLVLHARHHAGETKRTLPDGRIEYRVILSAIDEVARWIVGFGGGVRVAGPEELRDRVLSLARGTLEADGAGWRRRPAGRGSGRRRS